MARWMALAITSILLINFTPAENKSGEAIRVEVGIDGIPPLIQPLAKVKNIGSEPIEHLEWYVLVISFLPRYTGTCRGSFSLQVGDEKIIRCPSFITLFGPLTIEFVVNCGYKKCPVIKTLKFFVLPPIMFGGEIEHPEICFDGELEEENGTKKAYVIVTYVEEGVYYNANASTPNIAFIDAFSGEEYYVGENLQLTEEKNNLYTEPVKVGDKIEVQIYPPMLVKWLPTGATITKVEWFW